MVSLIQEADTPVDQAILVVQAIRQVAVTHPAVAIYLVRIIIKY